MAPTSGIAETVRFDVGGTKFKVSRSLVDSYPTTMLAKLISERWQPKPEEEIFIDRDGGLFQYVLHYMRDKKAHLPISVARESVMQELVYYGFENVPKEALYCPCANYEAAVNMTACRNAYNADIQEVDDAMKDLEKSKSYTMIAYQCFQSFSQGGSFDNEYGVSTASNSIPHRNALPWDQERFDKIIAKYGLKYDSHREPIGYLYVKVAPSS